MSEAGPSFRDVEQSSDPEALVQYLAEVSERPEIREHARLRAERAGIGPGARVLDVGCGIGSNTELLAERVGESGRVTGIDKSGDMIAAARKRVTGNTVSFEAADAVELPFEDDAFDVVWVERTLVHIEEIDRAVQQCKRVLAPGGTAVVAELDYAGVLIDDPESPDFTATILAETVAPAAHPTIGRELLRRLAGADLRAEEVLDELHRIPDFETLAALLNLDAGCRRAIDAGAASEADCREWWQRLAELSARGLFTGLIPVVTVIARG